MVTKSTARTFDSLDQQGQQAYHKSHINKTMAVAFTVYAFKDCMDNGGDGIKFGLFRAQSYKVAKRMVRQRVRHRDGSFRATGKIIRQKGDLFLVDCAEVASGFIQAHRIAQRVIEFHGNNSFLTASKIHFGVRRDYTETATGLKRSDELLLPPPTKSYCI